MPIVHDIPVTKRGQTLRLAYFCNQIERVPIDMRHTKTLRARLLRVPHASLPSPLARVQGLSAQSIWEGGDVENGQGLFNANCASCHLVTDGVLAAPGLAGIADRWGASDELLVQWIQNPQGAAATGDGYIKSLVERYVGTYGWMSAQAVSADDVRDIMAYVQNPPDVAATASTDTGCINIDEMPMEEEASSTLWLIILLVMFLLIAMSASGVNRQLTNTSENATDKPTEDSSYLTRLRGGPGTT